MRAFRAIARARCHDGERGQRAGNRHHDELAEPVAGVGAAAHVYFAFIETFRWGAATVRRIAPSWVEGLKDADVAVAIAWAKPLAFNYRRLQSGAGTRSGLDLPGFRNSSAGCQLVGDLFRDLAAGGCYSRTLHAGRWGFHRTRLTRRVAALGIDPHPEAPGTGRLMLSRCRLSRRHLPSAERLLLAECDRGSLSRARPTPSPAPHASAPCEAFKNQSSSSQGREPEAACRSRTP